MAFILNNITNNVYSDEWYTSRDTVETMLDIFPCKDNDVVLCPFDSKESQFVKVLQERGNKVIYGIRDFLENERESLIRLTAYTQTRRLV